MVEPNPDPTILTLDALRREIAMLGEHVDTKLEASELVVKEKVRRLDSLLDNADELRREQKTDTNKAVEAALSAQKESSSKMEKSISDRIASLNSNFSTETNGIHNSISDLKDRLTILEAVKQGATEQRYERRQSVSSLYATISIIVTVVLAAMTIIAFTG